MPIFIPHRGCPHDCSFCSQRKITGVDTDVSVDAVRGMISDFLTTVNRDESSVEVAFFGGSFTGLDLETQRGFLSAAAEFSPHIDGIRLSTRPDYINEEILSLLTEYGVTTVELGVQSSNDEVLRLNNRGHSFDDVKRASRQIKEKGISLGHQMMLGMYGSSPILDMKTVEDIIAQKPDCVRIYPVVTLKGTALEQLYIQGKYTPCTVMEAAELAKRAVSLFRAECIEVIRMGLHSSEDLEAEGNIVAGPYHQAFGELVESLIYRDKIEKEILGQSMITGEYEFRCKKSEVSKVIGHKRMNAEYFMEKYRVRLRVKPED